VAIDEAQAFFEGFASLPSCEEVEVPTTLVHHYRTTVLNLLLYQVATESNGFVVVAGTAFSSELCAQSVASSTGKLGGEIIIVRKLQEWTYIKNSREWYHLGVPQS
jgi:hypothetical protein